MNKSALLIISFYKKFLSPTLSNIFGHACRYSPTCSEYSYLAISKYGILKGMVLSVKRIIKCNPFFNPGFDPVP